MSTAAEIKNLLEESFAGDSCKFTPCAFFDDRMDCIRVITRDCSVREDRVSYLLTVLVDNYAEPGQNKYVGFTIKGARHFCHAQGWKFAQSVKMQDILNAVLSTFPGSTVEWFVEKVVRPIVDENSISQVDIPDFELQAA
jgi:hypothetical protein